MNRLPPRSTRTYTLVPGATLVRSFHQFGDLGDEAVPEHGAVRTSLGGGTSLGPEQTALRMLDAELHRAGCRPSSHTQQRGFQAWQVLRRSEAHTSELQSLMRISYAVSSLNNNNPVCRILRHQ